jgi:hypothetical protein
MYRQIIEEDGYDPPPAVSGKTVSEVMTERYMEAKDRYWTDSYKHRGGGEAEGDEAAFRNCLRVS